MSITDLKVQITEQALSNPKVQGAIAASAMAVSVDFQVAKWIPEVMSVVSMGLGCILTFAFIVHRIVLIYKDVKDIKQT